MILSLARGMLRPLLALLVLALGILAPSATSQTTWGRDYFPNATLINQDGKPVAFYDDVLRGKILVINFIFTSCGDVCPLDTAQLRKVQQLLGDRVGRDVFMYSISVDPETDTPERLRDFMQKFQVGPGWTFLTGARADIDLIQTKLGLTPAGDTPTAHSASIILANEKTGQWIKRSPYDNPQMLANLLLGHLDPSATGPVHRQSYANAVAVTGPQEGETLYRTRCASCHSIGGGDGLGPDLMGVTERRPAAWLARWIREPDRMLAEGDGLARAQLAQYRNLPMPNLKLSEEQVASILAFIDADTVRAMEEKAAASHAHHHH
jgi:protein SCO1/2